MNAAALLLSGASMWFTGLYLATRQLWPVAVAITLGTCGVMVAALALRRSS